MKEKLKIASEGDLKEYRSIPFWSWNNRLDEGELCRQIEDMKRAGTGGFIMHARTGLKEEYLGEKWFSCIGACLKKARELGMEAWIYDENGWPSGFAGGKLLEKERYLARFLEYSTGKYDPSAFAVFVQQGEEFVRVEGEQPDVSEYHNVYRRVSPANTDILNPEVTEAFIAETHEKYYARFKESFGKELAGFFTDEPQYYRLGTPYTPEAEKEFLKNGEDIRDGLIWLFVHSEKGYAFREKYYGTLNRLYVQNFYKKLYDWCGNHGCKLTGHSVEESTLYGQMYGGAAVMPTYEYEHVPGIDWLGRDCGGELSPRQVGSAAAQLGKKYILTETFGCAGYDVTPRELKSLGEYQYFNGVNKMCQHLYPYSLANRGKTDHPPVFSPQANWFDGFKEFNDYFARLGYIVGETEDVYDVGILHPIRDIWLDYIRSEDYESVKETERAFEKLLKLLRARGILYHFIDEAILKEHGSIEAGILRVGRCRYDTLIIPPMRTLTGTSYRFLKKFTGRLCALGRIKYIDGERAEVALQSNVSLDEILSESRFGFSCGDGRSVLTERRGEIGEFLFVKNLSRSEESVIVFSENMTGWCKLDLQTLSAHPFSGKTKLDGGGSLILVKDMGAGKTENAVEKREVTQDFRVTGVTENYLVLDYAQTAKGTGGFGEKYPVSGLFESLLREDYKGLVRVRQTFTLKEKMPLTLIMERAELESAAINGRPIVFRDGEFDVNFTEAEIGDYVREGENEFIYSFYFYQHEGVHFALFDPLATESLRNCLYYDTSIETVYLKGNFVVGKDFVLEKCRELPPLTDRLYEKGYPFFKGEVTLEGKLDYGGRGRAILEPKGRFMMAEVYANGKRMDIVTDAEKDVSSLLHEGENNVKLVLRSSLRNLLGPHHCTDAEPTGVSPWHFEFRGEWEDGSKPRNYTDEYHSMPFGVREIFFGTEK